LKELEEVYQLGFGITPDHPNQLLVKAKELASGGEISETFKKRREQMLSEKINVADFIYDYIINTLQKQIH